MPDEPEVITPSTPFRCLWPAERGKRGRMGTMTINRLGRHGVRTVADLTAMTPKDIADIRGAGTSAVDEVRRVLAPHGLSLRDDDRTLAEVEERRAVSKPRTGGAKAQVIAAAIDAAEEAGILPSGGIYGTVVMPDPVYGACCDGSAAKGPQYCTCWETAFDLEQQPVVEGEPDTRTARCSDCAFKVGSPERRGDERYSVDGEFLDQIVVTGERFFCHAGIRQAVRLVHPSGAEVNLLALAPGDYRPPIENGVPYKADGSPGELCAGWAARRLAYIQREAQAS